MVNRMVKVSVILPIYNVEEYLKECLDSVVNQTLKDIEIICIDDGSTDDSLEIIKEFARLDKRVKVVEIENSGAANARNIGLELAIGEYIRFVDADDNLVQAGVTSSEKPPAGAFFKGSKMDHWMRFNGAIGIHVGNIVERDSLSHGWVRLPVEPAEILFSKLDVGSKVIVK